MSPFKFFVLREFGSLRAYARAHGISENEVYQVSCRYRQPWPAFRKKASELLQVPEEVLFDENTKFARFLRKELQWYEVFDEQIAS